MQIKSDYLHITDVRGEIYGEESIKVYADVWAHEDITSRFGGIQTQLEVKITDVSGLYAIEVDMTTIKQFASWTQGTTTPYYFGIWGIDRSGGSFTIFVRIIAGTLSLQPEADTYSVQRTYVIDPYHEGGYVEDDTTDDSETGEGFRITQTKCNWYYQADDSPTFDYEVRVRNDLGYTVDNVEVTIDPPDNFEIKQDVWYDISGGTEKDIDKVISGQSRTVTFKELRPSSDMQAGDSFEIEVSIEGTIRYSSGELETVKDSTTGVHTITTPPEPDWNSQQDAYTEVFGEMFQHIISDTITAATVALIMLGTLAIIMGKASGNRRAYMFGSIVACFPVAITVLSLLMGWVSPSPYFVGLAGQNLAGFTQGTMTLIVLFMFLIVGYMFEDVIGTPF